MKRTHHSGWHFQSELIQPEDKRNGALGDKSPTRSTSGSGDESRRQLLTFNYTLVFDGLHWYRMSAFPLSVIYPSIISSYIFVQRFVEIPSIRCPAAISLSISSYFHQSRREISTHLSHCRSIYPHLHFTDNILQILAHYTFILNKCFSLFIAATLWRFTLKYGACKLLKWKLYFDVLLTGNRQNNPSFKDKVSTTTHKSFKTNSHYNLQCILDILKVQCEFVLLQHGELHRPALKNKEEILVRSKKNGYSHRKQY